MKFLKNLVILTGILAALPALPGCGQKTVQDDGVITVWHWMSDREEAFQNLADTYAKKTGVSVKFDLYAPSEAYTQKVKAAAQTRTLPDIFGILGESRDYGSFIRSGYVAELGATLSAEETARIEKELFDKAVAVNRFKEGNQYKVPAGLYGLPLDVTSIQFVYNKELFRKAGLDPEKPPATWGAFLEAARALRDAEVPVLVGGFGEIWMLEALASNWAMNLMGEEKVFRTYKGEVAYTDPDWVRVFKLFEELGEEGVMASGAITMVNKTAEQAFANGRAAMAFNGSWCVNVYSGMNPNLDYGVMLPPRISENHPMKIWGGAGSSLSVNARSPRVKEAAAFLAWMTQKEQQIYLAQATKNLPANRESLGDVPEVLSQFADDLDQTTHPNTYPFHERHQVTEALAKGIQSILIREKTAEDVAREIQEVKERGAGA